MTDVSVLSDFKGQLFASKALDFLVWLDPNGLHNLVAIDPVTKGVEAITRSLAEDEHVHDNTADLAEFIRRHNGKRNLYFSINEPRGDAREDTKLRRDEIGQVRAFHVDIDNLEGEPDWDMDCLPSAVIDSGGGRWGFWKLDIPIAVEDVAAIEAQNRALTGRFHGDTQAHNLDRIARLPGTLNIPNEAKRKKGRVEAVAKVLSLSRLTYSPAEVAEWCPPLTIAKTDLGIPTSGKADLGVELDTSANTARAIKWLLADAPEAELGNGSNGTTYQVAAKLKDFGVSQGAALELMLDFWNDAKSNPPWPAAKLQKLIGHAYRYGTAAAGKLAPSLAESEFEDESAAVGIPATPKRTMALEFVGDIEQDLKADAHYLIRDWYDRGSMVVTYGESNSGKTHVVLDQSLAIATGRPWAGHQTHQGLVVYVAAEGGFGVQRRLMAHKRHRPSVDWAKAPFALIRHPINLMQSQTDTKALIALVREAEAHFGQKCIMIVVDTLSRALAGGDENSSSDMGAFVKRCDEIRAATGATLHVIHHAGKNTAKGARGHSLLRAAVDTEIEIESNTVLSRKQRDAEAPPELRFDYTGVVLGLDAEGVEVRSVVLDVWQTSEFEVSLTPQTQKVFEAAQALVTQKTQIDSANNCPNFTPKDLIPFGATGGTLDRAITELLGQGLFVKSKRGLYKLRDCPIAPPLPQA